MGTTNKIYGILFGCLLLSSVCSYCQEFSVKQFRQLDNDISAYINPVLDLNEDACALVKVIGPKEFAFSTPLGIVKRKNEVGEIWLYIPQKSVMLTIKHPQWGVLRDFRFPRPLEGRLTYELTLNLPYIPTSGTALTKEVLVQKDTLIIKDTIIATQYIEKPKGKKEMKPLELEMTIASGISRSPSYGIRMTCGRKIGAYILGLSNFRKFEDSAAGDDYDTGKTGQTKFTAIAGTYQRITRSIYIFQGAGYGELNFYQQKYSSLWWKNPEESAKGVSAEAGIGIRIKHINLTASLTTIAFKNWEPCIGFGILF